jgi:hypothetical protein
MSACGGKRNGCFRTNKGDKLTLVQTRGGGSYKPLAVAQYRFATLSGGPQKLTSARACDYAEQPTFKRQKCSDHRKVLASPVSRLCSKTVTHGILDALKLIPVEGST